MRNKINLTFRSFTKSLFKNKSFAIIFWLYAFCSVILFLYSYTQIDLNLTLISYPLIHNLQKPFIYFGYYMRPESTLTYILLVSAFSALYLWVIYQVRRKKIGIKEVGFLTILISIILFFSYPAFSHDIFNYMFDAKIFTHYGDNPYQMRALDYPEDPWIRFMHWTHRTYPYGPSFLPITILVSFLGFNIFPITLFLFKGLMIATYLGSVYFIYKICQKILPEYKDESTTFFALNPLLIFESLVSGHHDILMMFLAIVAIYLFLIKKKVLSLIFFLLSVGIKYTSIFLAPMFLVGFHPLLFFTGAMATFLTVIYRINIQPWYLLWVLPLSVLAYKYLSVRIFTIFFSIAFLLRYIPFIYEGSWYPSAVPFQHNTTYAAMIGSVLTYLFILWRKRNAKS